MCDRGSADNKGGYFVCIIHGLQISDHPSLAVWCELNTTIHWIRSTSADAAFSCLYNIVAIYNSTYLIDKDCSTAEITHHLYLGTLSFIG